MNHKVVDEIREERGSKINDNIEMSVREIGCERKWR
jgi:hypothetical protein